MPKSVKHKIFFRFSDGDTQDLCPAYDIGPQKG